MKVFVLRIEELWSAHEDCEAGCGNQYRVHGVYSSKKKAEAVFNAIELDYRQKGYRTVPFYDIEEMELDV